MKTLPLLKSYVSGQAGGPWLTFIPGIGNDATFWQAQAEVLGRRFRVLSFDPWGHGDSPQPPEDCGFADVLDGVVQLWDSLGIQRSHVVGLGFGGSVSLALALQAPERVGKVAAFCCRPCQPDDRRDFWRGRRETARTQGMEGLTTATVDRWLNPEFRAARPDVDQQLRAMMRRTTVEGYRAYVGAFIEIDFSVQLGELTVPVMLVAAEHDHGGGPVEDMREMAARIPGAEFRMIVGSGHICPFEAPEQTTAVLEGFLNQNPDFSRGAEMDLLQLCQWRYATKKMDPTRVVPEDKLARILEAIRLAPTSSGLQPFQVLVITDPDLRARLRPLAKEQPQIVDCSYLLVFAAWDHYTPERINMVFDQTIVDRGGSTEGWENYRKFLLEKYPARKPEENFQHAARQAYLALAFGALAAANEGVDCTPMEGFDPAAVDALLGLREQGLKSVVMLPLGYRDSSNDWLVKLAKSRRPKEELFTFVG